MAYKKVSTAAVPKGGLILFQSETNPLYTTKIAQFVVTPGSLFPITNIVVTLPDGTDKTLTSVSAATNLATLQPLLKAEMKTLGYEVSENLDVDAELRSVDISGQTLTIHSELVFKSINSAGVVSFTKKATRAGKVEKKVTQVTHATPQVFIINGVTRSIAQTWTYGVTADATVKGHIETGLAAEISAGTVISVAVLGNGASFDITIVCLVGTTISLNGVTMLNGVTSPHFTA